MATNKAGSGVQSYGPDSQKPAPARRSWRDAVGKLPLVVQSWTQTAANRIRARFDALARRLTSPAFVILALMAATAAAAVLLGRVLVSGPCERLPVSLVRLEVAFTAERFARLLDAENGCRTGIAWGWLADVPFAIAYGVLLSALYAWCERWRRFDPQGISAPDQAPRDGVPVRMHQHAGVVVPIVAAFMDLGENLFLGAATFTTSAAMRDSWLMRWLVGAGSTLSAIKWSLLVACGWLLVSELYAGPRGLVLRRLRFSVLAVVLGALPLVAVAQGQEILQRLVEGDHPFVATIFGMAAVLFAAIVTWYCGRKLVDMLFPTLSQEQQDARSDTWYLFFAQQTPRILGVAALLLAGVAFARAASALPAMAVAAVVVFLLVTGAWWLMRRRAGTRPAATAASDTTSLWGIDRFAERAVATLLAFVIGGVALYPDWMARIRDATDDAVVMRDHRALRIGAWLCLGTACAFFMFVRYRRDIFARRVGRESVDSIDVRSLSVGLVGAWWTAVVASMALLAWLVADPVTHGRLLGPVWLLALLVANVVLFGTTAVWLHGRYRVPVVRIALALAVLFSLWNDNHAVRGIARGREAPLPVRPSLEQRLDAWIAARSGQPRPDTLPVVLVAAAGGGLRAAYWAAITLAAAQDADTGFASHVFAISSVSGGSLGGAVFASLVHDSAAAGGAMSCAARSDSTDTRGPYTRCAQRFMADDHLSPVLAKMVSSDLLQRFLPMPVEAFDRSTGLERSWERSYLDATGDSTLAQGLLQLHDGSSRATTPLLLLNATHVESGRRYIASPILVSSATRDAGDVVEVLDADLQLSKAVHNSARFTYVSPAGHLVRDSAVEYGRLVDGGYFENSGLATLKEVRDRIVELSGTGGRPVLRPIVVYLCNDAVGCAAAEHAGTTPQLASTSVNELLAPARALLATRDARGSLARAQLAADGGSRFIQLNVCNRIPTLDARRNLSAADSAKVRERVLSPPLGWLLSRQARGWMDASLGAVPGVGQEHGGCPAENARRLGLLRGMLASRATTIASAGMTHPAAMR